MMDLDLIIAKRRADAEAARRAVSEQVSALQDDPAMRLARAAREFLAVLDSLGASRAMSIARTNVETGIFWAREHVRTET